VLHMDIISGIVTITSAFIIGMAGVVLAMPRLLAESQGESHAITSRIVATTLVVYFVAVIDLLLIAQQMSLALGSFVVGLLLVVMLYVEPALRGQRVAEPKEGEDWRK
jgi:hypothetical protein